MKFTLLLALNAALVSADTSSIKDYLPYDGANFISTCNTADDTDAAVDIDEFKTCVQGSPNYSSKHASRINRTIDREWYGISNDDNKIDEDAAIALYWSFICDSDDELEQAHCAVKYIHDWIDDIYDCGWHDG